MTSYKGLFGLIFIISIGGDCLCDRDGKMPDPSMYATSMRPGISTRTTAYTEKSVLPIQRNTAVSQKKYGQYNSNQLKAQAPVQADSRLGNDRSRKENSLAHYVESTPQEAEQQHVRKHKDTMAYFLESDEEEDAEITEEDSDGKPCRVEPVERYLSLGDRGKLVFIRLSAGSTREDNKFITELDQVYNNAYRPEFKDKNMLAHGSDNSVRVKVYEKNPKLIPLAKIFDLNGPIYHEVTNIIEFTKRVKGREQLSPSFVSAGDDKAYLYILTKYEEGFHPIGSRALNNKVDALKGNQLKNFLIGIANLVRYAHRHRYALGYISPESILSNRDLTTFRIGSLEYAVDLEGTEEELSSAKLHPMMTFTDGNTPVDLVYNDIAMLVQTMMFYDGYVLDRVLNNKRSIKNVHTFTEYVKLLYCTEHDIKARHLLNLVDQSSYVHVDQQIRKEEEALAKIVSFFKGMVSSVKKEEAQTTTITKQSYSDLQVFYKKWLNPSRAQNLTDIKRFIDDLRNIPDRAFLGKVGAVNREIERIDNEEEEEEQEKKHEIAKTILKIKRRNLFNKEQGAANKNQRKNAKVYV